MCLVLVAPLLLIDVPPLLDYPNHLARMVALANPGDPFLSRFYRPNWAIVPDLGIDLVLPPLLHILPVHVAGRLVIACAVLLPVLGTAAYSRAILGRPTWWSLGAGLVAWNQTSLFGFLNFTAGVGFGLLLAASWVQWRDRTPTRALVIAVLGTLAVFFCHLMGLVCFALLMGAYELQALWSTRRNRGSRVLLAAVPFLVPLLLYLRSPLGDMPGEASFAGGVDKFARLIAPVENYVLDLDIATAVIIAAVLAGGLVLAMRGAVRAPKPTRPTSAPIPCVATVPAGAGSALLAVMITAALFLLAPAEFKGVANFDTRFIIILGFALFAAFDPPLPCPAYLLLGALFAIRMAVLSIAWAGQVTDLTDLRTVIAPVPPGSTVFLATERSDIAGPRWSGRQLSLGEPLLDHLPALLPIERRAWWPFMFDNESQQPIATNQPYRSLALRTEAVAAAGQLSRADLCGFDYLLVLSFGEADIPHRAPEERLIPVARSGVASLFAIDPARCAAS